MSSFVVVTIGILVVLGLIIGLRINAFIALIVAALAVSFLATGPQTEDGVNAPEGASLVERMNRVGREFGVAAGKIGLVIGFAAVIGEAMMRSGAADRIVLAFLSLLGEKRAPWALMGSGFVLSVPVFFDTVFYLLVPLARSLYRKTGKNFLLYVLAICAGGAITHTLVPPTPGPLAMAMTLDVSVGLMIGVGCLVAFPAAIAGIVFAGYLDKHVKIASLAEPDEADATVSGGSGTLESPVPLWEALLPVILPVLLISGDTIVGTLQQRQVIAIVESVGANEVLLSSDDFAQLVVPISEFAGAAPSVADTIDVTLGEKLEAGGTAAQVFQPNTFNDLKPYTELAGNPSLALLLSMTMALITWVRWKRPTGNDFSAAVETALLSGGLVILITAAGGAFGAMLKETGVAADIKGLFEDSNAVGLVSLFLAFGMAGLLKVAQGSSTTAMITVSAMMASFGLVEADLGFNMVYICTAIGAGSCIGSWMNDSGFWIVAKMSGLSETEALKTWTPLLALLGVVSLTMTIILTRILPLVAVS